MALIKCPECGKENEEFMKRCPECGYSFNKEISQQDCVIEQKVSI